MEAKEKIWYWEKGGKMSIIVPFDDGKKRVYPFFEQKKSKSICHKKDVQYREFSNIPEATQFYYRKFKEYHPAVIGKVLRDVRR